MYFDYGEQKVGFALKRDHFQKQIINVVTLIRFLVIIFSCGKFIFILGCCFILFSAPCRTICTHLFTKTRSVQNRRFGKEGVRLRQYDPVQENAYD